MAFLRSVPVGEAGPVIDGDGLYLRAPVMADHTAWAALREESRSFLTPWEPSWPNDDLTRAAFRRRLRRYQNDQREGLAFAFFVFRALDDALVGGVSLSNIRRGVAQTGALGYWVGQRFSRRGHTTRAVRALLPFAFETLRLHRVEAACMPHNAASIAVLERIGFVREGLARRYLCIDGQWRDHVLYGLLSDDPRE